MRPNGSVERQYIARLNSERCVSYVLVERKYVFPILVTLHEVGFARVSGIKMEKTEVGESTIFADYRERIENPPNRAVESQAAYRDLHFCIRTLASYFEGRF